MNLGPWQLLRATAIAGLLVLLVSARTASACDGGDDDGGDPPIEAKPFGGLAALDATPVRLSAVEVGWLSYAQRPYPRSRVQLVYRFVNSGKARTERVGVRVSWTSSFEEVAARPTLQDRIPPRISIDGAPFDCALESPEWRPWGPGTSFWSGVEAWCTGTLEFPSGPSRRVIEYEAPAWFRGTAWATLRQDFVAEASWRGPVETLDARLPLAALPGSPVIVSPPGVEEAAGVARWHLERPDLARLPPIYVGLDPLAAVPGTARLANQGFEFAASSTLGPLGDRRYDPDRALDGDGGTAWCEKAAGPGIGEWFEVRTQLSPEAAKHCRVRSFSIVPGLARSKTTWHANDVVLRFRLSSCTRPEEVRVVDLTWRLRTRKQPPLGYAPGGRESSVAVELQPEDFEDAWELDEKDCFRVTILGVREGRVHDTCIAEFLPVLTCSEAAP